MEEPKKLSYDWRATREELFSGSDSYMSRDRLYIGIYQTEDGYPKLFPTLR